jgi:tight adherence protein C
MNLPDFFDMLTTTIEAGLGLSQALTRVCEEIDSPVSDEFQEYLRETRMGSSPREAFENMIDRNDSETFKQVISSISQASEMGLGLGKSIRSQTEFMRKIQYERMKKKAMQAPVKMSIPLVLFIFPALIVVIIGPAIIQAMNLE